MPRLPEDATSASETTLMVLKHEAKIGNREQRERYEYVQVNAFCGGHGRGSGPGHRSR